MKIELDMYQTMAAAVLVLMLGKVLKRRINMLERFCIPAPGKFESIEKWWKGIDRFSWTCDRADLFTEFAGRRSF